MAIAGFTHEWEASVLRKGIRYPPFPDLYGPTMNVRLPLCQIIKDSGLGYPTPAGRMQCPLRALDMLTSSLLGVPTKSTRLVRAKLLEISGQPLINLPIH